MCFSYINSDQYMYEELGFPKISHMSKIQEICRNAVIQVYLVALIANKPYSEQGMIIHSCANGEVSVNRQQNFPNLFQ